MASILMPSGKVENLPHLPEGSVVLVHGPTGTAYQRLFADGRYHSTTHKDRSFEDLNEVAKEHRDPARPLIAIHVAPAPGGEDEFLRKLLLRADALEGLLYHGEAVA